MSWWETGDGEDVIGDQPADILRDALRLGFNGQAAALESFLQAVVQVLRDYGSEFLEGGKPKEQTTVEVIFENQPTLTVRVEDAHGDDRLVEVIRRAFNSAAQSYKERFHRNLRPSELMSLIGFIVRSRPGDFFSNGNEYQIRSFRYVNPEDGIESRK